MNKQIVIVQDIEMSFWSMVKFMVKWAIATIPAAIILVIFVMCFMMSLSAIGGFLKPLIALAAQNPFAGFLSIFIMGLAVFAYIILVRENSQDK